ncbi:MAG: two-component regulator propeller domain-containing protein, partial [Thermoanaerobaculia bacterium]
MRGERSRGTSASPWPGWVAVLLLGAAGGRAAALPLPEGRPAVRFYSTEQGLPQSVVLSLSQDAQGFLWLGTQDGAAMFDGRAWTPVSLPSHGESNYVHAVLGTADGSVWFGTNAGLLRRRAGHWESFRHGGSGLPDDRVLSLLE